jgi:hypothetical protein
MIKIIQYCKCSMKHEFISTDQHPECEICKNDRINHMVVVYKEEFFSEGEIQ